MPDYIANCGLYLMESYGGLTMDHFYKSSVKCRLTIARNLLLAAKSLTEGHRGFRIYLTDATKDNIAVDEETLLVTFIDLDDVIIQYQEEQEGNGAVTNHKHQKMECENCFAFSSQDICAATQSDINIFTICQVGRLVHPPCSTPPTLMSFLNFRFIAVAAGGLERQLSEGLFVLSVRCAGEVLEGVEGEMGGLPKETTPLRLL